MRLAVILILAFILLAAIGYLRPPEYDEAYSMFLTAGDPRPVWPAGIFTPAQVASRFAGYASLGAIAHNLRMGDVHPPLYFWALEYWRRLFGPTWFTARLLSVCFATASLGLLGQIARRANIPVIPAILICLLSYGFAYTGTVARGFALAQLLNLLGLTLALSAGQSRVNRKLIFFLSGLAFSTASFTNYLAIFTALGVLACARAKPRDAGEDRQPPLIFFLLGLAACLPADLYFFSSQHASRLGQFTAFSLPHALAILAKDQAAALYGGLPVYAAQRANFVIIGLALFTISLASHLAKRPSRFLLIAAATPAGLIALGLIFHNTPVEIRYCAFASPYLALALAKALPTTIRNTLIAVQTAAILGLAIAPATMQPQGRAARSIPPGSLAIIPYGNDGVGIPGPFIAAARPNQRILILSSATLPNLAAQTIITLAALPVDNQSKALVPILNSALSATCSLISTAPTTLTYGKCRPHQQP